MNYNSLGSIIYSSAEQGWQDVVPDTFGEVLYNAMCK